MERREDISPTSNSCSIQISCIRTEEPVHGNEHVFLDQFFNLIFVFRPQKVEDLFVDGHGIAMSHGNVEVRKTVQIDLPPQVHDNLDEVRVLTAQDVKLMKTVMVLDIGSFFARFIQTFHLFQAGFHFRKGLWADVIGSHAGGQTLQVGQDGVNPLDVLGGHPANRSPFPRDHFQKTPGSQDAKGFPDGSRNPGEVTKSTFSTKFPFLSLIMMIVRPQELAISLLPPLPGMRTLGDT